MGQEDISCNQGRKKNNKQSKHRKQNLGSAKDDRSENPSRVPHRNVKAQKPSNHHDPFTQRAPALRKKVDPETAKYFSEIANLFESNGLDLDERSTVCGNAIEETRGKELELATDMVISHTLQTLLEGCSVEQLCGFLLNCAKVFSSIATDKFGSHVAETALKSLAIHLQDEESYSITEEALTKICQVVVVDSGNVMCSRYGSHVLRSLLCLCKGVPLDSSEEFHVTKPSTILAARLNSRLAQSGVQNPNQFQRGFPDILKLLVREMLNHAKNEIAALRVNMYSSFVLQATLKLLVGDDLELLRAILIILGCHEERIAQGNYIETSMKQDIMDLLNDSASSHLLEVIMEVAPETLYDVFLEKVFKGSLFDISSHHCGNFVVQALVSSARSRDQMDLIWEELGPKFKELLEFGKPGVIASLVAACQRLQTYNHECCQALATAVSSESESPSCVVPHILFLESYFREKSSWKWPMDDKMHVLGCLMLQTIFRFSNKFIRSYVTSITSMEADHVFQTAKDPGGGRVLEAFLGSDASAKQKLKVVVKLQDHFGDLSMHPSGSFTVEKCFTASNLPLKEAIASELLAIQSELSKTKHGPYLLKKLDIDGFARWPAQWKSSQASKETAYKDFQATFGSDSKLQAKNIAALQSSQNPLHKSNKRYEEKSREIDHGRGAFDSMQSLDSEFPGFETSMGKHSTGYKRGSIRLSSVDATAAEEQDSMKFVRNSTNTSFVRNSGKRNSSVTELADLAGKSRLSAGEVRKLFKSTTKDEKKQFVRRPFLKKQKR